MNKKLIKSIRIGVVAIEAALAIFSVIVCFRGALNRLPLSWVFNVSADLVCLFLNIFFCMGTMLGIGNNDRKYTTFFVLCCCNFLAMFLDIQSWINDGVASQAVVMIINTCLYIVNQFISATSTLFMIEISGENEQSKKKYHYFTLILLIITIIAILLNIRFGYFFTVSPDGVYSRGRFQFAAYAYTVIMMITIIILCLRHRSDRRLKLAVLSFTLIPFAAAVASIFIYGLSITYACILISIVMVYSIFFMEVESDQNKIKQIFERFVASDVVNEIVDNADTKLIPGKRYNATVLVSDLRAFTAMSETMDPEKLVDLLNHYFAVVNDIVMECGGMVTEFLGDGVKCVFGAPNIIPDHAERALAAALSIQDKMPEINAWNQQKGYPNIETGIGVNTGVIILGSIGGERSARYTAVGQTVDKTFDIESCSFGGQVLASYTTVKAVKNTEVGSDVLLDIESDPDKLTKTRIHEVYHLGEPWNVGHKREFVPMRPMLRAVHATFTVIIGKKGDAAQYDCQIVELSVDQAIIECKMVLGVLDNIRLDIPGFGTIFAKVKSVKRKTTHIGFTSRPEGFARWVDWKVNENPET